MSQSMQHAPTPDLHDAYARGYADALGRVFAAPAPTFPVPCPPWCADCWKGDNHWENPDPGVTFHHGEVRTIVCTNGPDKQEVDISLERFDADGEVGSTQVWLRLEEGSVSMSLDEAELLAAELFSLLVRGRQGGEQ